MSYDEWKEMYSQYDSYMDHHREQQHSDKTGVGCISAVCFIIALFGYSVHPYISVAAILFGGAVAIGHAIFGGTNRFDHFM